MANTITSTPMTSAAPSITQNEMREVGDQIRYLGYGEAVMTSLIQNSLIDQKTGNIKKSKGLISKRAVKNIRYEMYNRSPRPFKFTVASGTEAPSSGVTFTSVNGIQAGMMIHNPRNKTSFRAELIASTNVKGTSVGATTFSCEAGDVLVVGATAVKAGSDAAIIVNGTDDNSYNTLQFSRLGCSIDWVMEKIKELAGGDRFTREKMYLVWEFLRDQEISMILGDMTASFASKNTTTGTQTGYTTDEFPTTKGLINLAAKGYNMEGVMTLDKIRRNLPLAMSDTINDNQDLIAFVSNEGFARIQELMDGKHIDNSANGNLDQFGIKSYKLITSGPRIELVKHSLFNVAGLNNSMLIFDPASIGYVHLEGFDLKPNNGIQDNDTHAKIDELVSYFGIETKDAGQSITHVTNCF